MRPGDKETSYFMNFSLVNERQGNQGPQDKEWPGHCYILNCRHQPQSNNNGYFFETYCNFPLLIECKTMGIELLICNCANSLFMNYKQ